MKWDLVGERGVNERYISGKSVTSLLSTELWCFAAGSDCNVGKVGRPIERGSLYLEDTLGEHKIGQ